MRVKDLAAAGIIVVLAACTADMDTGDTATEGDTAAANGAATGATGATGATTSGSARAELHDTTGAVIGLATLDETAGGVSITVNVNSLSPGEHGVHIHAVGQCEAQGESPFESASGHFNPDSTEHGLENPAGPHAGDLPNMTVAESGAGSLTATTDRFTLSDGPRSLFDADGAAVVVHADPDDMMSDPAGNAGTRVACGVLGRS